MPQLSKMCRRVSTYHAAVQDSMQLQRTSPSLPIITRAQLCRKRNPYRDWNLISERRTCEFHKFHTLVRIRGHQNYYYSIQHVCVCTREREREKERACERERKRARKNEIEIECEREKATSSNACVTPPSASPVPHAHVCNPKPGPNRTTSLQPRRAPVCNPGA